MSAGDEMINAAHLIVKLCDEKLALEREVANLKERSDLIMEKGHNLIDERNVLRNENENLERDVVRLKTELEAAQHEIECLKANFEIVDDWEARAKRAESHFKAQHDEINQLKDTLAQRQSEIDHWRYETATQLGRFDLLRSDLKTAQDEIERAVRANEALLSKSCDGDS